MPDYENERDTKFVKCLKKGSTWLAEQFLKGKQVADGRSKDGQNSNGKGALHAKNTRKIQVPTPISLKNHLQFSRYNVDHIIKITLLQ